MNSAERCEHPDCGFENRLEYCELEASDPEEAMVVTDLLDYLLYDSGPVTSEEDYLSNAGPTQEVTRSFSYVSGDYASGNWPLVTTKVVIRHIQDREYERENYEVAVCWRPERQATKIIL